GSRRGRQDGHARPAGGRRLPRARYRSGLGRPSGRRGARTVRAAFGRRSLLPRRVSVPAVGALRRGDSERGETTGQSMTGRNRLTVLHVVANRWWTGSAEPVLRLVLGLRARGHRALLGLAPGDRFEAKAREAGVEPVARLHLDVKSRPAAIVGDARRLRTLVSGEGVDVVHAHHGHDHCLGWWAHGSAALARSF